MTANKKNGALIQLNGSPSHLHNSIQFLSNPFRNSFSRKEYIASVVENLAQWTGCECVGLRIIESSGVMPYEAYVGFSKEFWESENCLSFIEHECACTRIVTGHPDSWDRSILTSCGSIYTDDLQGFAQKVPVEFLPRYRGKCIGSEFSTLAVVPVRYHAEVVGLLHIADKKSDLLSGEDVLLLESLSDAIAEVINKFNVNEALKQREAELKSLENRLQQSRKMEMVGTMAGGIAHDFNNLLSVISGNLELIESCPETKNEHFSKSLEHIGSATEQAINLTKQILAFSRREDAVLEPYILSVIIDETFQFLRSTLPETVEVVEDFTAEAIVNADATQLRQVVANLCSNAVHAMNGMGVLKVNVKEAELLRQDLPVDDDRKAGRYAVLAVSDTGCGIDADTLNKIFNPFFTTKPVGAGIGLGLSVVQGVVERHNGFVTVESEEGEGTTFEVYFPIVSNKSRS